MVESIIDNVTEADDLLKSFDEFPEEVYMISLGNSYYAAVNATTPPPDPMTVGLLAVFASEEEITKFTDAYGLSGYNVKKKFEEAREIAVNKPKIHGLALQENASTKKIHWVR
jgi:hypothetical protein